MTIATRRNRTVESDLQVLFSLGQYELLAERIAEDFGVQVLDQCLRRLGDLREAVHASQQIFRRIGSDLTNYEAIRSFESFVRRHTRAHFGEQPTPSI